MSTKQWTTDDMVDMSDKIVFVTGGNGGIGYVSCKEMLRKNAKVYVGARDSDKSRDAIKRLREETGKDPILISLDLSDLHQVRKAAEQFLQKESRLDVLLNNAGIMAAPIDRLTKDSYDLQFGTNVLGHFHLTSLLLPALLASPSPRVINVSSMGHTHSLPGGIQFETLKGPKQGTWLPLLSLNERYQFYGQSKLGNILHANELARRYKDKGLVAISVHPGVVKTDLMRNHYSILSRLTYAFCVTPEEGAVTQLYAANAPEAQKLSGKYLIPYAKEQSPSKLAQDQDLAKKMWDWCESELRSF
ncbi:hypothetical protein M408DRAFT_331200 [Serendipita vermifera MAFF 305830]|uniref:NAD(P)-binding protein n=1 Tax=Serendipita vermifera MAFF 305830 TaxID=933852 RepID=A0A0C2WGB1_SERVB|nr:hypothetical protein M408DRAFT_331200 [Serendipita vermifera MAFF 305830]